jgi:hypothetical protein
VVQVTYDVNDPAITAVHLQYQADDGTWTLVAANIPATGTHDWTVPTINSSAVMIRVASAAGGVLDECDSAFSIASTSVRFIRGNGYITFHVSGRSLAKALDRFEKITISRVTGERVRELPITSDRVVWDLRDNNGLTVSRGVYLFRFEGTKGSEEFKLLVD